MSLPAWNLAALTPILVDGFQYPVGTHTNEGGWIGTFTTQDTETYGGEIAVGAATQLYRVESWPSRQWACYQTIVPLDDAPGAAVAVRSSNGSCYALHNVAYTSGGGWWFTLYRFVGGTPTLLQQWQYGDQNPDGAFVVLESLTVGNTVELRASVAMSPWGFAAPVYDPSTMGPHDFPADIYGEPYLLGTYVDSSASRLLSGTPGVFWGSGNNAGGFYGFNAGLVSVARRHRLMFGSDSTPIDVSNGSTYEASPLYRSDGSEYL